MSILPMRPRPGPPLDRLAAEGAEQRSQTACIGVSKWGVILAPALSPTLTVFTVRAVVILVGFVVALPAAALAETFSHPWGFKIDIPIEWEQLGDGGVSLDPVSFSSKENEGLYLRIYRLPREPASTGFNIDPDAESDELARLSERWIDALSAHFPGLTGVQVQPRESSSPGAPPSLDLLASMRSRGGFSRVIMRAVLTQKLVFLVTLTGPARSLSMETESARTALQELIDSFEVSDEFPLPTHLNNGFSLACFLILALGIAIFSRPHPGASRPPSNEPGFAPPSKSSAWLSWCLILVLGASFAATREELVERVESRLAWLQELATLEQMHPGISEHRYQPRAQSRQAVERYRFLRERFEATRFEPLFLQWGFIPSTPRLSRLFTHPWLHMNAVHLLSNLFFLWLCGRLVERTQGRAWTLGCFILGGLAGAWMHYASAPANDSTLVGASGATSALLGASLLVGLLQPLAIRVPGLGEKSLGIPTGLVALAWIGAQLWQSLVWGESEAFWVHAGGVIFGMALALVSVLRSDRHDVLGQV